ncbi:MAG: hypothetical protein ACR2GA_03625 [Chloroflexota bacterium]
MTHRARTALLLPLLLVSGCGIFQVPSQHKPDCSWDVAVPANADHLCTVSFDTVSAVVRAQVAGNDAAIRRIATTPRVARRIISYGRQKRAEGIIYLHVVPSITLTITAQHKLGVGIYITGKTHHSTVSDPETVYLRVHGNRGTIIDDQPNQVW